jgi:hypothetical protein
MHIVDIILHAHRYGTLSLPYMNQVLNSSHIAHTHTHTHAYTLAHIHTQ